jgi:hypothetical protein
MPLSCEGLGDFHAGRIRGFYATLVDNGKRWTTYQKLCANCILTVVKDHQNDWLPGMVAFRTEAVTKCTSCASPVERQSQLKPLYVTFYTEKQQRVSYYGFYCEDCAGIASNSLALKDTANGRG